MSDGLSEGARWAEEHEERQQKIDALFRMVVRVVAGERKIDDLRSDFMTFDTLRYQHHLVWGRLIKGQNKRWQVFRADLAEAIRKGGERPWANVLALALQYASPAVTEELRLCSGEYTFYPIALYAPNGRGNQPTWYGNVEAVLEAIAQGGMAVVVKIEDRIRSIVSVTLGSEKENTDPERATLRFLAAYDHRLNKEGKKP
ncbi:MAG: hypothetical protein QY323_04845 [Patescibacteria group bacterium]|nr:MAG: hypothetical protein QY323_04845 [Patescibacteria group bacterium]